MDNCHILKVDKNIFFKIILSPMYYHILHPANQKLVKIFTSPMYSTYCKWITATYWRWIIFFENFTSPKYYHILHPANQKLVKIFASAMYSTYCRWITVFSKIFTSPGKTFLCSLLFWVRWYAYVFHILQVDNRFFEKFYKSGIFSMFWIFSMFRIFSMFQIFSMSQENSFM